MRLKVFISAAKIDEESGLWLKWLQKPQIHLIFAGMEGRRQVRLARQIQKDMGDILLKDGPMLFGSTFISVSTVRLSPDLSYARVYVSFIKEDDPQKVVDQMNARKGELRHKLGEKLRSHVRKIPELDFHYDDTMDYVEKIDKLFDKIKKEEDKGPDAGQE